MSKSGTFLQFPEDQEGAAPLLATKVNPFPMAIMDQSGRQISDVVPSLPVTSIDHYMIHLGHAYVHSDIHTIPAIGAGTNIQEYIIVNTTDLEVHLRGMNMVSTQGNALVELFHGVSTVTDGDAALLHNKNFDSLNTATATLTENPTGLAGDIAANLAYILLLVGGKSSGGVLNTDDDEVVLKKDEKVLLRITNNSNQADVVGFNIDFLDVGAMLAELDA